MSLTNERLVRHGNTLKANAWDWVRMGKECNRNSQTGREYRKRWAAYALRSWRSGNWYIKRFGDNNV